MYVAPMYWLLPTAPVVMPCWFSAFSAPTPSAMRARSSTRNLRDFTSAATNMSVAPRGAISLTLERNSRSATVGRCALRLLAAEVGALGRLP